MRCVPVGSARALHLLLLLLLLPDAFRSGVETIDRRLFAFDCGGCCFRPLSRSIGSFQLVAEPSAKKDIRLASIYRYKGLDAPAVVLCDIDRYVEEDFKKLMYVGCSRARAYLAVLLTE